MSRSGGGGRRVREKELWARVIAKGSCAPRLIAHEARKTVASQAGGRPLGPEGLARDIITAQDAAARRCCCALWCRGFKNVIIHGPMCAENLILGPSDAAAIALRPLFLRKGC
jgi:hypothetical protein